MAVFSAITEILREEAAGDAKFWQSFVYFFELQTPAKAFGGNSPGTVNLLFPLVLNPTSISIVEPYTVTETPGFDGGLFVEENGVIHRMLRIEGTTGFKPKPNNASPGFAAIKLDNQSFHDRGQWFPGDLSGQRHFQFLQDKVFRTYGDLKRDPNTAKDTLLAFHNPKDDEHWLVVPREFRMDRVGTSWTLYRYTIELLIVNKYAGKDLITPAPDKSALDTIRDGISAVRHFADLAQGAVNDIVGFVAELDRTVRGVFNLVNQVAGFLNSVTNLIDGVATLISQPFRQVAGIIGNIENAISRIVAAPINAKDTVLSSFRQMQDAFHGFALHPEMFETDVQTQLRQIRDKQSLVTGRTALELRTAASNPPNSLQALDNLGSFPMPGDERRANSDLGAGRNEPVFASVETRFVGQSDTIQSIAAKFLGTPVRWRQIALLNNLKPPYISSQGLPGTKKPGDAILIPSSAPSTTTVAPSTVLGTKRTDPLTSQLLGRDLLLGPSSSDSSQFDLVITPGNTDAQTVEGVPNLIQAINTRVSTEQGSDVLYPQLGYKSMIGLSIPIVDTEILRLRVGEAVAADPRIASVRTIQLAAANFADAIIVDMDAAVRGFNDPISVSVTAPTGT